MGYMRSYSSIVRAYRSICKSAKARLTTSTSMGKVIEEGLTPAIVRFIAKQRVFFVATAPSDVTHHVNVSPKASADALAVLDAHTLVFADLSGSGAETAAPGAVPT